MPKSERRRLTDRLDKLCREIIRLRDEDTCQKCGKRVEGSNSQASHVVPKGNGASWRRFDLINLKLMCHRDHIQWWHLNILDAQQWFKDKFPARYEYLEKYRHGKPAKITDQEMRDLIVEYQLKVKDLKDEIHL